MKQRWGTFTDRDWVNHIWKGSMKTRFQYCQNSCGTLLYIRAIQGHIGGDLIEPELMGHVAKRFKWKQFLFHRGCSFNPKSILEEGHIAGREEIREGRQTVFFTPLDPYAIEETIQGDMSKPRKVHCKTEWTHTQNAVCWIHLARAQEKGIPYWQTKSHAIIAHKTVPPDCIETGISQNCETTSYQRLYTPRPAPRIFLKIAWNQ